MNNEVQELLAKVGEAEILRRLMVMGHVVKGKVPLVSVKVDELDGVTQAVVKIDTEDRRLVDADAFRSTIRPLCDEDKFAACTLETVKRLMVEHINNAPTIVPADAAERSET